MKNIRGTQRIERQDRAFYGKKFECSVVTPQPAPEKGQKVDHRPICRRHNTQRKRDMDTAKQNGMTMREVRQARSSAKWEKWKAQHPQMAGYLSA